MTNDRSEFSRRRLILSAGVGAVSGLVPSAANVAAASDAGGADDDTPPKLRYCLNSGTIMGQKLPLVEQVEVAARAGYDGIEPWIRDIQQYVDAGGSLAELRRWLVDLGLRIEGAIGFAQWIVDDDRKRAEGLRQMRHEMELVRQLGGTHIAAPPAGANRQTLADLDRIAERYRAVLEVGHEVGVTPQLEIWGSSKTLSRLSEAAYVTIASGRPDACLLLDAYHLFKGGSGFEGLKQLNGRAMHCFHVNDYPAEPAREQMNDSHRVYPGDGVCPLTTILRTLVNAGFCGALSLELFNREYWKQDALVVAKTGLQKMRDVVAQL